MGNVAFSVIRIVSSQVGNAFPTPEYSQPLAEDLPNNDGVDVFCFLNNFCTNFESIQPCAYIVFDTELCDEQIRQKIFGRNIIYNFSNSQNVVNASQ